MTFAELQRIELQADSGDIDWSSAVDELLAEVRRLRACVMRMATIVGTGGTIETIQAIQHFGVHEVVTPGLYYGMVAVADEAVPEFELRTLVYDTNPEPWIHQKYGERAQQMIWALPEVRAAVKSGIRSRDVESTPE